MRKVHTGRGLAIAAIAACLAVGGWRSAHAVSFQSASGDWSGSWDTTLGYLQGWRTSSPDCRLIAIANSGCGYSPNIDNGDLNYLAKATFTEAATFITELGLNYKEKFGIFVRASGLYDFEVMDNTQPHVNLTHDATSVVGSYVRLLDAFGYWRFHLGSMNSELRVGQQVVDWGESTFIPGGLNQVDYFDVTALQTPGAELKQALLPDQSVIFNTQITKNLSTQLLYLFSWHKDILEPNGAYFSTNDVAGPGGKQAILGFGAISDFGVNYSSLGGTTINPFQAITRLGDHDPSESGQYGIKFKYYLPNFSQGTELGFYFLNYTSRLPVVSFQTGTQAGLGNGFGAAESVGAAAQVTALALAAGLPLQAAIATGAAQGAKIGQQAAAANHGNLSAATALQYATIGANTFVANGGAQNPNSPLATAAVNAQAQSLATNEYTQTQGLYESFPQNIKMLGLSFNTQIQKTGTALQGEVAYRHDVPLQLDDVELIYASITPFESGTQCLLLGRQVLTSGPHAGTCNPPPPASSTPITTYNQYGLKQLGQTVQGYELMDTWHFDVTATQVFANILKASQAVLVVEAGADYANLPDKLSGGPNGYGLRFDGPGTNLSGNPNLGGYPQFPAVSGKCVPGSATNSFLNQCLEPGSAFATSFAWGYVIAGRLEYDNAIHEWNLIPHATWSQDVNGVSPGPGGAFLGGRFAYTVGLTATTREKWDLDVSYSNYGGDGQYNLLRDRGFIAASVKFSF